MKKILLIGASSSVAIDLYDKYNKNYEFIRMSRTPTHSDINDFNLFDSNTYYKSDYKYDGLVYFPGTINLKNFSSLSIEDFKNDYNINFLGLVQALQFYLPSFNNGASFVFFSTTANKNGMPFHSSVSSVKSAIVGLTKSLAAEWAPKYRVNCISPSIFESNMSSKILRSERIKERISNNHPLKRYGSSNDISEMVNFLISEKSSWITGQDIFVDGGMSNIKL